tara:strand:- start:15772 stop:16128 length:357 start_codon:yes stop_codon:yes gene_type:complete
MSSLQGYINTSYARLVETFGEPTYRNGDKTSVEWVLKIGPRSWCIYDYKWSCSQDDRVFGFHIGGVNQEGIDDIARLLHFTSEDEAVARAEAFYGPDTWAVTETDIGLYEIQRPVVLS